MRKVNVWIVKQRSEMGEERRSRSLQSRFVRSPDGLNYVNWNEIDSCKLFYARERKRVVGSGPYLEGKDVPTNHLEVFRVESRNLIQSREYACRWV